MLSKQLDDVNGEANASRALLYLQWDKPRRPLPRRARELVADVESLRVEVGVLPSQPE